MLPFAAKCYAKRVASASAEQPDRQDFETKSIFGE
jgi:hypothetical protein